MNAEVIGGADGPTAIFVSSPISWGLVIGAAILVAGFVIVYFIKKKKD